MAECKRCLYNNEHPFGLFISNDICSGCMTFDEKNTLNWEERYKKLDHLLSIKKKSSKTYDCVVPVIGDAEDFFVIKKVIELGLNPLVVSVNSYFLNDIGWRNLHTLITNFDVDSWIYNPEIVSYKELIRTSLRKFNHMYLPWQQLHTSFPVHVANEKKIPLIIWGGQQSIEQVGKFSHEDEVQMTAWSRVEHDLFGKDVDELIGNGAQINERNLNYYRYPKIKQLGKKVTGIYLSNYIRWDPIEQNKSMVDFGFTPECNQYTFDPYERAGSSVYYQIHDLLKFERLGYRKITDHCTREIRHGRITKEEAKTLAANYTFRKINPKPFFDWLGVTKTGYDWFVMHRLMKSRIHIGENIQNDAAPVPYTLSEQIITGTNPQMNFVYYGKGI